MANTQNQNSGNFANDPERAREAGKKGGEASGGNTENLNRGRNQTQEDNSSRSNNK